MKNKKNNSPIICGLDVGTSKISLLVVREHTGGRLEFISSGHSESRGISKGLVVNLDDVAECIRKAVDEAKKKVAIPIESVRLGAGGDHFEGFNSRGAVSIDGERQEVTHKLASDVVAASQSLVIPPDREIRHILTQEFVIDGRGGIEKPMGLYGSQLDVNVHIITCRSTEILNLIRAVNRVQIPVRKVIAQPMAAASAVITRDQKELGAVMIDIGSGSTNIVVFQQNAVRHTKVLPVGGHNFTVDLAICLQTSIDDAEYIKKTHGTVLTESVSNDDSVTVPGIGSHPSRSVPRKSVCHILNMRATELLNLIRDQINSVADVHQLYAGAVITGGGCMLDGMMELAQNILGMPVCPGIPKGVHGLPDELAHPKYASVVGLTLFGTEDFMPSLPERRERARQAVNKFWSWLEK